MEMMVDRVIMRVVSGTMYQRPRRPRRPRRRRSDGRCHVTKWAGICTTVTNPDETRHNAKILEPQDIGIIRMMLDVSQKTDSKNLCHLCHYLTRSYFTYVITVTFRQLTLSQRIFPTSDYIRLIASLKSSTVRSASLVDPTWISATSPRNPYRG